MELLPLTVSAAAATLGGIAGYGAVWPRSQIFGPTIYSTNSPSKLALTFDDGPNPAITPQLLELLARYQARATFFVIGKFVREHPALVREIIAAGHVIGNHTETHPNLFWCGIGETREQLHHCSEAVFLATGQTPRWFRPPFGLRSPWLGGLVREFRVSTIMWTRIPGDWRVKPSEWLIRRTQCIADHAQRNLKNPSSRGDILCLHDGNHLSQNADRTITLAALEHWLPRWRDLGLKFVTIEEAISDTR